MQESHSMLGAYLVWILGFTGAHRFYLGRPITGTIWLFTGGLFLIGWIIDLFLIPGMTETANRRHRCGTYSYTVAWLLLTYLGVLGIHRFYLGRWITGLIWLLTGGLLGIGIIYDFWTLNAQVNELNGG